MYPSPVLLQEVGRVTIAGSRLDVQMGYLWWHLDPSNVDQVKARAAPAAVQAKQVRRLAQARLRGDLQQQVLSVVEQVDLVRHRRNDVVHQDWLLRSHAAMRPVAELAAVEPEDLEAYLTEWDREAVDSADWKRVPARSLDVEAAQSLESLRAVERALAQVTDNVQTMVGAIASARETGHPEGYVSG